ncbi:MAG: septum formation protein Maf [Firmicutes bacterium]|nr:septum formation protein Maf [Bacillota bacterium]
MNLLTDKKIILASSSPRRLDLLRQAGVEPEIFPVQVQERQELEGLSAETLVIYNATLKAQTAAEEWKAKGGEPGLILGADTVVVQEGRLFGKPADAAEAAAMLFTLSGAEHSVFTGQCLIDSRTGATVAAARETKVTFDRMSEEAIVGYVASGEPLDKAGAYGMQGLGGLFVRSIEGAYSTVVGLSLPLLYQMVRQLEQLEQPIPTPEEAALAEATVAPEAAPETPEEAEKQEIHAAVAAAFAEAGPGAAAEAASAEAAEEDAAPDKA